MDTDHLLRTRAQLLPPGGCVNILLHGALNGALWFFLDEFSYLFNCMGSHKCSVKMSVQVSSQSVTTDRVLKQLACNITEVTTFFQQLFRIFMPSVERHSGNT